jgi:threonine/homoserine/homoserine lactone efflux protein
MSFAFLFRGLLIGFAIAAPVGPIGLLCIQRTLQDGRKYGFASGLGAASADTVYGFIAAFGLTFISTFLVEQQRWLSLIGGLFLLFLGVRTFLASPAENVVSAEKGSLANAYFSTFLLTLTNPVTILSFVAIFAGLGLSANSGDYGSATLLVVGVFLGSAAWWLLLSGIVSLFRNRFNARVMVWVNRGAGVIIAGFGAVALISLLR